MTKSVYIVGGAGSGKSTFMAQLLAEYSLLEGPLEDLYSLRNAKALVTLRGHRLWDHNGREGLYLGCLRDQFPGTDGLDRASSPTGEAWLKKGFLPPFIVSEGATLATRRFIKALHEETDLLLVHLTVPDDVRARRFAQRGSFQDATFVKNTVTRSANLVADMGKQGVNWVETDTSRGTELPLFMVLEHLG